MGNQYQFIWQSGLFLLLCLVLFFVAKVAFKLVNSKININQELIDNDNIAFYISYLAYFLAFVLIIGGVMKSEGTGDFWNELQLVGLYGLIGIVALNLSAIIKDKVFHSKISTWNEIVANQKVSVGILKGANYVSAGVIISGIMLTEVNKPIEALVFLAFALIVASLGFIYYNLIMPFNVRQQIYDGNIAVSLSTAGVQVAFAILIYSGFQITHCVWQDSLMNIGIDVIGGIIILPVIRLIVDKVFLPNRKITDELINQDVPNLGLGLFEATAYIGGALLFVWCWNL
jgi:uncharacterized membrane protein YjfL (UPF0719 family)